MPKNTYLNERLLTSSRSKEVDLSTSKMKAITIASIAYEGRKAKNMGNNSPTKPVATVQMKVMRAICDWSKILNMVGKPPRS